MFGCYCAFDLYQLTGINIPPAAAYAIVLDFGLYVHDVKNNLNFRLTLWRCGQLGCGQITFLFIYKLYVRSNQDTETKVYLVSSFATWLIFFSGDDYLRRLVQMPTIVFT